MKNKKVLIIISVIIIALLIYLLFITNNKGLKKFSDFNYYSGSSGESVEFNGVKKNDRMFNVDYINYKGPDKKEKKINISIQKISELLEKTKKEDCNKQSYEYQCGDSAGCYFERFYITYSNDEKVCYEINDKISEFFKNLVK